MNFPWIAALEELRVLTMFHVEQNRLNFVPRGTPPRFLFLK